VQIIADFFEPRDTQCRRRNDIGGVNPFRAIFKGGPECDGVAPESSVPPIVEPGRLVSFPRIKLSPSLFNWRFDFTPGTTILVA